MNERDMCNDYLNMMSAPNYNNIGAPQKVQHEYLNRWVWNPQTENSDHITINSNHHLFNEESCLNLKASETLLNHCHLTKIVDKVLGGRKAASQYSD
jgi:hypothetical protein